eukprot:366330-Chlamydomonas_euryale.AAC.1
MLRSPRGEAEARACTAESCLPRGDLVAISAHGPRLASWPAELKWEGVAQGHAKLRVLHQHP